MTIRIEQAAALARSDELRREAARGRLTATARASVLAALVATATRMWR